ncbi:peptidoglycan-binding domain-containing protein [Streptomyces macrosporus]|uniref:Uncharacterized protein n=1 Tax=Streptomyces macrosporus TaxID=44032 RepID=A0ABP5XVX9_9ACTN
MPPASWDVAALPLVLAGPVVRRVDENSATVWVALKAPRKVTLEVYEGATGDPAATLRLRGTRVTARIGEHLHVVAVTATGDALRPGTLHRYAMRFAEDTATPTAPAPATAPDLFAAGVVAATVEEARRRLVYSEAPGAPAAPGFVTPPATVDKLRVFHTSNRKPHGEGPDALSLLDQVLRADAGSTERRPQQLFLTGDQIYADDVAEAMLHLCTTRGRALLGRDETFPGLADPERALHPGFRGKPARELFKVTAHRCDSHLLRFSEFCAMYLLAWSDVLWPTVPDGPGGGPATLFAEVHPDVAAALGVPEGERLPEEVVGPDYWNGLDAVRKRFVGEAGRLDVFRQNLVAVRRVLANVPTYTALDGHDVTDGWFGTARSVTELSGSPLGRRLLGNALAAYAVFQGWGNTPEQFAAEGPAGAPGRTLLAALAAPDHTADAPAREIALRTGVPRGLTAGSVDREPGALTWHYTIAWRAHQVCVPDTRTDRFYPGGPDSPSALLYGDRPFAAMVDPAADTGLDNITLVVSPAPVVGHPYLAGFAGPALRALRADAADLVADHDGWGHRKLAFEALVARLLTRPGADGTGVRRRRVVALSGDTRFGFAARLSYEATAAFQRPGTGPVRGVLAQLNGGPAHDEYDGSLFLHSNGFQERSKAIPAVRRVAWANPDEQVIDAGLEPDPARPGRFVRWRAKGFPAVTDITAAHTLERNPDWRYRVDFYRHEDPDRLRPPTGAPQPVTFPPEDAAVRRRSLRWYVRAAQNHSGYRDRFGEGKQLVGRNNLGEIQFVWKDGDAKSVVQTLWWRIPGESEGAPLTRFSVPLDVGQPPSLPVENLPELYRDRNLEEGQFDAGEDHDILDLQRDLQELGFLIVLDRTGRFDRSVRWAVRELQTYAKRGRIARVAGAFTRLAAAPGRADTTLTVESAEGFPAAPFRIRVGFENLEVTEVAGNQWTVVRAKDDTGAAAYPVGEGVTWLPRDVSVPDDQQWYGYASALESVEVPEARRYTGQVSGCVDGATREIIARWKVNRWRCPVVVESWVVNAAGAKQRVQTIERRAATADAPERPARPADNIWRWDDTTNPDGVRLRTHVRDFSDRWTRPAARPADTAERDRCTAIGRRTTYKDPRAAAGDPARPMSGPVALPERNDCWPEAEILPERLIGRPLAELPARTLATFKVIRAVAEVEALGFFDAVNCYDHAFASLGLCHWTLGARIWQPNVAGRPPREQWNVDEGELWAFLAYLRTRDEAAFNQLVGDCGIAPDRTWIGDGKTAAPGQASLWVRDLRKYTAYGTATDRTGTARPLTGFTAPAGSNVLTYRRYGELEFFKTWHWFHRFVMAGRTSAPFQRAMWDMARMRLRDVLSTPWNAPGAAADNPAPMDPGVTVGDVFRSEKTIALVHRWHVFSPANVARDGSTGVAATALQRVVVTARTNRPDLVWGTNPRPWTADHQEALAAAILERCPDPVPAAGIAPADDDPTDAEVPQPAEPHPAHHGGHRHSRDPGHTLRYVEDWPYWYAPTATPAEQQARNPRDYTLPLGDLAADQATLRTEPDFQLDTDGLPA